MLCLIFAHFKKRTFMLTSSEIRQAYLDFFKSKGHQIVPSAPIVVKNDPTLLFTNAGMNQFKDFFLGNKKPDNPRIADTQKCLRVSGKHNDLEEVGVDTYHHTMFEMLGNFSFGDYFKTDAIPWSWELVTERFGFDGDRLWITVHESDDEAEAIMDRIMALEERVRHMPAHGAVGALAHLHVSLFVRDHYSRRLAAFQGVNIDAEDPGLVPPAVERFK